MNEKDKQWVIDEIKARKESNIFQTFDCPVCKHLTVAILNSGYRNLGALTTTITSYSDEAPLEKLMQCLTCGKSFRKSEVWKESRND